jgi:hypothetical protein
MKIKEYAENIFAQAIALEQNSRSKNIIAAYKNKIFIMNADSTVLFLFQLKEDMFKDSVCFYANDYESNKFEEQNGKIVFVSSNEEYERQKSCNIPDLSFEVIKEIYDNLKKEKTDGNFIELNSRIKTLLNDDLSHVELVFENGAWEMVQRDLFSGSIVRVKKKNQQGIFDVDDDLINENLSAIGLRTSDFFGLFTLNDNISLHVYGNGYAYFHGAKYNMSGFIAGCLYDDLGTINYLRKEVSDGRRKKQKNRKR